MRGVARTMVLHEMEERVVMTCIYPLHKRGGVIRAAQAMRALTKQERCRTAAAHRSTLRIVSLPILEHWHVPESQPRLPPA